VGGRDDNSIPSFKRKCLEASLVLLHCVQFNVVNLAVVRECLHKFPDWPPGTRTANGTALCHYMQLYRYFCEPV
jgi:hypothetical protein